MWTQGLVLLRPGSGSIQNEFELTQKFTFYKFQVHGHRAGKTACESRRGGIGGGGGGGAVLGQDPEGQGGEEKWKSGCTQSEEQEEADAAN